MSRRQERIGNAGRCIVMASSLALAAPWNGADKNLARLLVTADTRNCFVVQTSMAKPWPDHVQPIRLPASGAMPTRRQKLRALAFLLRHSPRADLVHIVASLDSPSRWSGMAVRAATAARHTAVVHTIPSIGDRPADPRHFPGDISVVFSRHTEGRLTQRGIANVWRLSPPVDLDRLRVHGDVATLSRKLQLGPRAVLYPAHYGPESGMGEMIAAFGQLDQSLADAVLVLACRARAGQHAPDEIQYLRDLAARHRVVDRVRILEHVDDMPALIRACGVTALVPARLASKMDLPLVVLEALALERPVIICDRPPMNEALLGECGFAVPFGDIGALAGTLSRLLADEALRARLGQAGRAAVAAECHPDVVLAQYQTIYDAAMRLRRKPVRRQS